MNTLTLGNDDEIVFQGFTDLPATGEIQVRIIKDTLILSAGRRSTAAAHICVAIADKIVRNSDLYRLVQHYSGGKPLTFLKSPAPQIEYVQLKY